MSRYIVLKRGPRLVDVHVGHRVRIRRTLLGMSQTALGEALGLTFQQLQKYERGANRISSSRLYDLSQVLEVPVSYFFDGMPDDSATVEAAGDVLMEVGKDPMTTRETLELMRAYYRIADPDARQRYRDLVRAIAGMSGDDRV